MSSEPFDVVVSVLLMFSIIGCYVLVVGFPTSIARETPSSPPSEPSHQHIEPQPVLQSPVWQRELPRPREPPEPTYEVQLHPIIHTPRPYNGLIPRAERGAFRPVRRERDITEMSYRERKVILDMQDAVRRRQEREEAAEYQASKRAEEAARAQQATNRPALVIPTILVTDVDGSAHEKPATTGTTHLHVTIDDEEEQSKTADEISTTATTEIGSDESKELSDDTKTTSHEGTTTVANPEPSQIPGTSPAGTTHDSGHETDDTSMMSITSQPIANEPLTGTTHDFGHETAGTSMMSTTQQPIANEPLTGTTQNSGHETAGMSMMSTTQQPTTYDPLAGATDHTGSTAAGNSGQVVEEQAAPYVEPANELFQVDNMAARTKLSGWLSGAISAGQQDNICNRYYFEELLSILTFWFAWITNANAAEQMVWDLGKVSVDDTKLLKNALEQIQGIVEKHCASIDPELGYKIVAVFNQLWANNDQAVKHIEQLEADEAEKQQALRQEQEETQRIENERVRKQAEFEEQQARTQQLEQRRAAEAQEAKRQQDLLDEAQLASEEAERKAKEAEMGREEQRTKDAQRKHEEVRNRKQAEISKQQARKQISQTDAEEDDPWKERDIARKELALKEQQKEQQPPQQKPIQPQQEEDEERMGQELEEEFARQGKLDKQSASTAEKFTFAQQATSLPPTSQSLATGSFGFGQQSTNFPSAPSATEPFAFGQQPPAFVSTPQMAPQTRRDPIQRNRQQNNADRARRNANRPKTTRASQVVPTPPIPAPQNTNASQVAPASQNPASLVPNQTPWALCDPKLPLPQPTAEARAVTPSTFMPDEFLKAMAEHLEQTNAIVEHWEQLIRDPSVSGAAPEFKYECLHDTPGVLDGAKKIYDDYEWIIDCYTRCNKKGRYWRNKPLHARRVDEAHLLYRVEKDHDFLRKFATETRKYTSEMPQDTDLPAIVRKTSDMTYILLECLYKADCKKLRPMEDGDDLYYGPGKYESMTILDKFHPIPPQDENGSDISSLTSIESVEE